MYNPAVSKANITQTTINSLPVTYLIRNRQYVFLMSTFPFYEQNVFLLSKVLFSKGLVALLMF